ncbi:MAG: hypothetical protein IPP57_13900 [Candidatus Obscuribacter sp.]|nr:hypothetical protein [Candidatus Obscuribacter sp.]
MDGARAQPPTTSGWSGHVATALPEKNLFNEEGGNPDVPLAARDSPASCPDLLGKGAVDAAWRQQTAEVEAGKASALVDTVIAARDFVLKEVVVAIAKLKKLRDEIPAADTAVATLAPNSWPRTSRVSYQVTRAHTVADTMDGELGQGAQVLLRAALPGCPCRKSKRPARTSTALCNGVVEVLTRLKTLEDQRNLARATVKSNLETFTALASKLQNNAFTTSGQDRRGVCSHPAAQPRSERRTWFRDITDWVEAAAAAARVTTALKAVDTAIDDQRSYESA